MIISKIKSIKEIVFPVFETCAIYMQPFNLEDGVLSPFQDIVDQMIAVSPITKGRAYLTIDSKFTKQGKTHRRPGPHVDGNYLFDWGGGGWLTGRAGRELSPEDHKRQYCSPLGGTLITSNVEGCQYWEGEYKDIPAQGGDCAHFNLGSPALMTPNHIYLMNSTGIHESIPMKSHSLRTLIRITLPNEKIF